MSACRREHCRVRGLRLLGPVQDGMIRCDRSFQPLLPGLKASPLFIDRYATIINLAGSCRGLASLNSIEFPIPGFTILRSRRGFSYETRRTLVIRGPSP